MVAKFVCQRRSAENPVCSQIQDIVSFQGLGRFGCSQWVHALVLIPVAWYAFFTIWAFLCSREVKGCMPILLMRWSRGESMSI